MGQRACAGSDRVRARARTLACVRGVRVLACVHGVRVLACVRGVRVRACSLRTCACVRAARAYLRVRAIARRCACARARVLCVWEGSVCGGCGKAQRVAGVVRHGVWRVCVQTCPALEGHY